MFAYLIRQSLTRRIFVLCGAAVLLSSAVGQIMRIALVSDSGDMMELRDVADWVVRPRILGIPGVSQVVIAGGDVRQLRVTPDPRLLDFFGIPITQLEQALAGFN